MVLIFSCIKRQVFVHSECKYVFNLNFIKGKLWKRSTKLQQQQNHWSVQKNEKGAQFGLFELSRNISVVFSPPFLGPIFFSCFVTCDKRSAVLMEMLHTFERMTVVEPENVFNIEPAKYSTPS